MIFAEHEIDWPQVWNTVAIAVAAFLASLGPAMATWLKSQATYTMAKAAKMQSDANAKLAVTAKQEATAAKDAANNAVVKLVENTAITKDVNDKLDALIATRQEKG